VIYIPDLDKFGKHPEGLTGDEIIEYLTYVYNSVTGKDVDVCPSGIVEKFYSIAGANTVAVGPKGESLMYRHDVKRFVDKLFFNTDTYFD